VAFASLKMIVGRAKNPALFSDFNYTKVSRQVAQQAIFIHKTYQMGSFYPNQLDRHLPDI